MNLDWSGLFALCSHNERPSEREREGGERERCGRKEEYRREEYRVIPVKNDRKGQQVKKNKIKH